MINQLVKNTFFIFLLALPFYSCSAQQPPTSRDTLHSKVSKPIVVGANQTAKYLPLLKGKRVAILGNPTSVIFKKKGYTHLVDSLLTLGINIRKVFSPEHGFRGESGAGEKVKDGTDSATGLPIISLYGNHKKPTVADLEDIDILIFDIQDVGLRFYTYISTLHYVMEACAENEVPMLILDRPNPNGNYIDGPILEKKYRSFVGLDPVPVVHGMTIGEYARMINGQGWLKNGIQANLTIIPVKNYRKSMHYALPIPPSPNLPNDRAINLYPSLCFFEGTNVNAGRGTAFQFQVFGSPSLDSAYFPFSYVPRPNTGSAHPKNEGKTCYGLDLRKGKDLKEINLNWLIEAYQHTQNQKDFFNPFFENLAGTAKLRKQIESGMTAQQIRATWQLELKKYQKMRAPYLLYPLQ